MDNKATLPMTGMRVLDLSYVFAVPYMAGLLSDLGADVIKVEAPHKLDQTRGRAFGPYLDNDPAQDPWNRSGIFYVVNRGKRSLAVDFEKPEGQEIVRKLATGADVLIENFKTGGLAKYGLDYVSLSAINPRLIYCSITGFGHDGPYAPRAGYDFIIQGMGGTMDLTGEPDGEPQKVGYAVTDIFTGIYSVVAIQAALARREKTGRGGEIDMALFDTQVSVLANQALNFLVSGRSPRRMGNAHPNIVPYQVFQTADGPIIVATGNDRQNRNFCRIVGKADLPDDPRFRTNADRVRERKAFLAELAPAVALHGRAALLAALETANVPAGPINTVGEAFADPQIVSRNMRIDLPALGARGGSAPSVRSPILLDGEPAMAETAAPRLGQHTDSALAELGITPEAITTLRASGVIG